MYARTRARTCTHTHMRVLQASRTKQASSSTSCSTPRMTPRAPAPKQRCLPSASCTCGPQWMRCVHVVWGQRACVRAAWHAGTHACCVLCGCDAWCKGRGRVRARCVVCGDACLPCSMLARAVPHVRGRGRDWHCGCGGQRRGGGGCDWRKCMAQRGWLSLDERMAQRVGQNIAWSLPGSA